MNCDTCGTHFNSSFDAQRYCWDCWNDGMVAAAAPREDYGDYLASRDWQLFRAYRIALAGGRCERCGNTRRLQAHHATYERVGRELLEDLEALCRGCHEHEHGIEPEEQPMRSNRAAITAAPITVTPVAIRSLTVGEAPMTLAVYRQLPERALVAADGTFNGTPWGHVNLCPSRDCPERDPNRGGREHRHVVWEAGGQLYRDVCRPSWKFEPFSDWTETWAVLAAADTRRRHLTWGEGGLVSPRSCRVTFVEGLPAVECELPSEDHEIRRAVSETVGKRTPPPCECTSHGGTTVYHHGCGVTWRKAQDLLEQRALALGDEDDELRAIAPEDRADRVAELIRADVREEHLCHQARCARWEEVKALPLLFLGAP